MAKHNPAAKALHSRALRQRVIRIYDPLFNRWIAESDGQKHQMPEPSLELLQRMVQQILDGQAMLRKDNQNMRRRLTRIERALLSLQRTDTDQTETDTDLQEQIDALTERLDNLEQKTSR